MTPAVQVIKKASMSFELHSFDADSSIKYAEGAAAALNVPPERVLKTLVAKVDDGTLAVALVPATKELNLKSLASLSGAKRAELADPSEAQRSTGYVIGGISPLGQKRRLPTYIDASAMSYPTVFVSGGRRGLEIELSPSDLATLCEASIGAIAR